jgi:hypothetical protein
VGVFGEEEGAEGVLGGTVLDDGLGDGGDVIVVEGGGEGAAAVAGGSEGNALGGDGGVRAEGIVGGDEAGDVDEVGGEGWLAGGIGLSAHAVWGPRGMDAVLCNIWDAWGDLYDCDGGARSDLTKKLVFDGWVR